MKKRLVLCCDGTWNKPQANGIETNVRRFFEAVGEGNGQMKEYIVGVGTRWYDHLRGGVMGEGIDKNIMEGYGWLARQYPDDNDGDIEVFLIGFSRGAYTARSLAGMIRNCGLLKKENVDRIREAYEIYRKRQDDVDSAEAVAFRNNYAREVRIRFLGCWDTVGALGIPLPWFSRLNAERYQFHDITLSRLIDSAAHAIAIDEQRQIYDAVLMDAPPERHDRIEQRWFIGAHTDVGGGYSDRRLSDIALAWMMRKAADCGLAFSDPIPVPSPDSYMCSPTDSYAQFLGGLFALVGSQFSARYRRYYRAMNLQAGSTQVLDASITRRYNDDPKYRPLNKVFEIIKEAAEATATAATKAAE